MGSCEEDRGQTTRVRVEVGRTGEPVGPHQLLLLTGEAVCVCVSVCVEVEKGGYCHDNVRTVMQCYLQNLSFCATVLRAWMTLGGGPG